MNHAAPANAAPEKVPDEFVKKVVDAFNSHDIENFMPLFHPEFAKCMTPEVKPKFAFGLWWGRKADLISTDYTINATPVDEQTNARANDPLQNPYAKYQQYPVLPDVNLRVEYTPTGRDKTAKQFKVKWEGDTPYLVDGCPTPDGLAEFDRKVAALKDGKEKARKTWEGFDAAIRADVKKAFTNGKANEAMKRLEETRLLSTTDSYLIRIMLEDGEL